MKVVVSPTRVEKTLLLDLKIEKTDWYLVSVSARVKSKRQRGNAVTDDEDLRVEINGQRFPQFDNSQRCFDSPAAFSGAQLKNNLQIVNFIIHLTSGSHLLSLIPDEEALIEKAEVNLLNGFPKVHLELNQQAQRANGRPWMTFVLVNLGLKSFSVKATVNWHFFDGDDLKIIVDGKVKKNPLSLLHRDWVFSASPLRKIKGEEKPEEKTFAENLPVQNLHYLEIWVDESPTIHSVDFYFTERIQPSKIQKYKDGRFGRDYNKLDQYITEATNFWNEFFLKQTYPPPEPLDPSLVKAIIYRESRLGYYPNENIVDVMQVWDPRNPPQDAILGKTPANEFISPEKNGHISYSFPPDKVPLKVETREESIFWGVRWLYYKAQHLQAMPDDPTRLVMPYVRKWSTWKEAIRGYNANKEIVEEYLEEVFSVYENGVDLKGNVLWRQ